jgi:hypothetical protein
VVIDFDRSRQASALRRLWGAWHAWRAPREAAGEASERAWGGPPLPLRDLGLLALPALLAALGAALVHRRRTRRESPVPPYYRSALRLLSRRGARRTPGDTARGFAARAAERMAPGPALAFERLTELYLAERFGGRPAAAAGAEALRALRDSLRG